MRKNSPANGKAIVSILPLQRDLFWKELKAIKAIEKCTAYVL
jgi:hypothetical protein